MANNKGKITAERIAEQSALEFGQKFANSLEPAINKIATLENQLKNTKKEFDGLIIKKHSLSKEFNNDVKTQQQLMNLLDKKDALNKQVNDTLVKNEKLEQERLKTKKLLLDTIRKEEQAQRRKEQAQKRANKKTIEETELLKELKKNERERAKESLGLVGAYQKLNKQRTEAQKRLADLLATEQKDIQNKKAHQKEIAKTRDEYEKLNKEVLAIDKQTNNYSKNVGNYKSAFEDLFTAIRSGDLEGVKGGFAEIKDGIKGMTMSALKFIATPIGATITAIASIGIGVKKWVDFNLEIEKTNDLIRNITGTTGESTNAIRSRAEAMQDVFGTDVKESIDTAKSLVDGFGISYDDAFDLIEDGAVRGKLNNEEFLESLKEYPTQFQNAGFSASDFVKVVNAGVDLSIYKDKLPDAIKEANLSLTEQTKSTRDALVNAFGSSFTDDILSKVKNGEITTKEALQEISKQAETANLNQQQQAQLTADLFKGAGEDAGGSIKIFQALNTALNEEQKELTETQKLRKQELETKEELNEITTQLFGNSSKGFGKLIQNGKIWLNKILIGMLKGGVDLYNWFIDLNNESKVFSGILSIVGKIATSGFEIISILISNAWKSFKSLGDVVAGIFTFDLDRIKKGFAGSFNALGDAVSGIKDKVIKDVDDVYDAFQGKNKRKKITLKALVSTETKEIKKTEVNKDNNKEKEKGKGKSNNDNLKSDAHELAKFHIQLEIDKYKEIADNEENSYKARLIALVKQNDAKRRLLEEQANYELTQDGLTSDKKKLIQKKLDNDKKQLLKQAQEQAGKLYIFKLKNFVELEERLQKELNKKTEELRRKYQNGEIKSVEEYDKQLAKLKFENSKELLNEQITFLELELNSYAKTAEQKKAIETELYKYKKQLSDLEFGNLKNEKKDEKKDDPNKLFNNLDGIRSELMGAVSSIGDIFGINQSVVEGFFNSVIDGFDKSKDKAERFAEIAQASISLVSEMGNAVYEQRISEIDEEISKSDEYYNAEIEKAENKYDQDGRLLEDGELRKKILEEEREKKRQKLEKKKREEQRKQAQFNKATSALNITLNTAQAVMAIASTGGGTNYADFGVSAAILTGLTIALGAAQLAAVLSAPLPKYKLGRKDGKAEWAIVGDGGRSEIIEKPTGETYVTPAKDTLTYLGKGDRVYPSMQNYTESKSLDYEEIFRQQKLSDFYNINRMVEEYQKQVIINNQINEDKIARITERNMLLLKSEVKSAITEGFKRVKIHNHNNIDIDNQSWERG